jgi:hypothetical protein
MTTLKSKTVFRINGILPNTNFLSTPYNVRDVVEYFLGICGEPPKLHQVGHSGGDGDRWPADADGRERFPSISFSIFHQCIYRSRPVLVLDRAISMSNPAIGSGQTVYNTTVLLPAFKDAVRRAQQLTSRTKASDLRNLQLTHKTQASKSFATGSNVAVICEAPGESICRVSDGSNYHLQRICRLDLALLRTYTRLVLRSRFLVHPSLFITLIQISDPSTFLLLLPC